MRSVHEKEFLKLSKKLPIPKRIGVSSRVLCANGCVTHHSYADLMYRLPTPTSEHNDEWKTVAYLRRLDELLILVEARWPKHAYSFSPPSIHLPLVAEASQDDYIFAVVDMVAHPGDPDCTTIHTHGKTKEIAVIRAILEGQT